jgi:hypothetical protein
MEKTLQRNERTAFIAGNILNGVFAIKDTLIGETGPIDLFYHIQERYGFFPGLEKYNTQGYLVNIYQTQRTTIDTINGCRKMIKQIIDPKELKEILEEITEKDEYKHVNISNMSKEIR